MSVLSLKEIREIKGLSRQDVSDMLDIPKRTIEGWETGVRKAPDYVMKLINDKLLNMTQEDIISEKTYCVVEYDFNEGASIVKCGTKKECTDYEDSERNKLTQEEQLFRNYSIKRMSDYEKELEYNKAADEYRATLPPEQQKETVEIDGKTYAKCFLDFQKKFYNKE